VLLPTDEERRASKQTRGKIDRPAWGVRIDQQVLGDQVQAEKWRGVGVPKLLAAQRRSKCPVRSSESPRVWPRERGIKNRQVSVVSQ